MPPLLPRGIIDALSRLRLSTRRPSHSPYQGDTAGRRPGGSWEFQDYREYEPGDDWRSIDWNIYHRLDKLFVRIFAEERTRSLLLLKDISGSMSHGTKAVYSQQITAALGYVCLWHGDTLRVADVSDTFAWSTPPLRGRHRVRPLLTTIQHQMPAGATRLTAAFAALRSAGQQPSPHQPELTILISDLLDPGWEDALGSLASQRGERVVVHVLDPDDWRPSGQGGFRLTDGESDDSLDMVVDHHTLALFHETARQWLDSVAEACASLGIAYYLADTEDSLEQLLLQTMRERGLLT